METLWDLQELLLDLVSGLAWGVCPLACMAVFILLFLWLIGKL